MPWLPGAVGTTEWCPRGQFSTRVSVALGWMKAYRSGIVWWLHERREAIKIADDWSAGMFSVFTCTSNLGRLSDDWVNGKGCG